MLPVIQSLWIGSSLSNMEKLCISSFLRCGHSFHLYLYENLDGIPEGTVVKNAADVIPKERIFSNASGTYAMFSNLFRYALLQRYGGIWVDMDVVCLKPFNFQSDLFFASEKDKMGNDTATTCVISTPQGEKVMESCFSLSSLMRPDVPWGSAGPKLLNQQIAEHNLEDFIEGHELFCPIHWWETEQFVSSGCSPQLSEKSSAVHLWREMWRRKGHDVASPHVGSFYANLLELYGII